MKNQDLVVYSEAIEIYPFDERREFIYVDAEYWPGWSIGRIKIYDLCEYADLLEVVGLTARPTKPENSDIICNTDRNPMIRRAIRTVDGIREGIKAQGYDRPQLTLHPGDE